MWWAHLVGAFRVHPHKQANFSLQKDRGFAHGAIISDAGDARTTQSVNYS
jgi:hypothetical protein